MKSLLFVILTFLSLNSFPGDKGNLSGLILGLNTSSLEKLLVMSWEIEDELYIPLTKKDMHSKILTEEKVLVKYVSLLNELMSRGEDEILSSLVFENELFYEAFGIVKLNEKMINSQEEQFKKFWNEVKAILISKQGSIATENFFKRIDSSRLGYRL